MNEAGGEKYVWSETEKSMEILSQCLPWIITEAISDAGNLNLARIRSLLWRNDGDLVFWIFNDYFHKL